MKLFEGKDFSQDRHVLCMCDDNIIHLQPVFLWMFVLTDITKSLHDVDSDWMGR